MNKRGALVVRECVLVLGGRRLLYRISVCVGRTVARPRGRYINLTILVLTATPLRGRLKTEQR